MASVSTRLSDIKCLIFFLLPRIAGGEEEVTTRLYVCDRNMALFRFSLSEWPLGYNRKGGYGHQKGHTGGKEETAKLFSVWSMAYHIWS